MAILGFLVQLLSGAMLLLFSVRFMRIGIERLWISQIRSNLSEGSSHLGTVLKGTGLGFLLQGGTVVMLMAAGLAGTGAIPLASAAVLALGADMGSALAVRFLQLPISAVGPLAILVGATVYLRSEGPRHRNLGRVALGFGLIFLSLSIIRQTVAPISELDGVAAVIGYLNRDVITAALAGIVLTVVMHSSVAAILTAVAFAGHAAFGPAGALGFVVGCNLGSALLSLWLLNSESSRSKVVGISVAIVRCGLALISIGALAVFRTEAEGRISLPGDEAMVAGHLAFNLVLLLFMPVCTRLCAVLDKRIGADNQVIDAELPSGVNDDITLVVPALKRKLSGMLDTASLLLDEVTSEHPERNVISELERRMNSILAQIRQIYARLPREHEDGLKDINQIVDFAIRVERCGDVLSGKLEALRAVQAQSGFAFSAEGQQEIADLVNAVRETILIAHDVNWTGDIDAAERLVRHKAHVAKLEAKSRANHLARLRSGNLTSLGSSDHHLETIASLKEINSKFATIGYAILDRQGALKKSRLKTNKSTHAAS